MNSFSKAILITGASHRLGLVLAEQSINLGFHAIIHYRTERNALSELLKKKPALQPHITIIYQELTKQPEQLIEKVLSLPLTLYGLVNNASIFTPGDLSDCNHFEHILQINALIPSRLAAHFYKKVDSGWIINITDAICNKPNLNFQNYRLSKAILELITIQQALRFAPVIRVNAIAPGAMLPGSLESHEYFNQLELKIPLKKTGDMQSLIETYRYLVQTPYITGQIIRVDGGWNIAP
jgi:NAD(P)-dependent dehydrogenase (short-subunit alcohol dehydrogenase family)